jgi:hypothetical protein
VAVIVAALSVAGVLAVALSDWPLSMLSGFWSEHAMLTNLVSSAVFAGFTIAVIERWLHTQEQRQAELRRRAAQQRLTVVRSAAYNAVARGPIAQRRIMWFLVHGGEFRRVPEFGLSDGHRQELRAILARLELAETSEHEVMRQVVPRPDLMPRLALLVADERWRRLVHDVLLDVVHNFRVLLARWSALLLTTEESLHALKDLAEQAEELSLLFVEYDGGWSTASFIGDEGQARLLLWRRAFTNAVALEEALIEKGGERTTMDGRFITPGRALLEPDDLTELRSRDAVPRPSLRVYDRRVVVS